MASHKFTGILRAMDKGSWAMGKMRTCRLDPNTNSYPNPKHKP